MTYIDNLPVVTIITGVAKNLEHDLSEETSYDVITCCLTGLTINN